MIICVVAQYVKTGIYSLDATIEGINDYAQTWWLPIVGIVIGLIIGAVCLAPPVSSPSTWPSPSP